MVSDMNGPSSFVKLVFKFNRLSSGFSNDFALQLLQTAKAPFGIE